MGRVKLGNALIPAEDRGTSPVIAGAAVRRRGMDPDRAPRYGAVMTATTPTLADLRRAGTISSSEIVAAVDAYMRDPASGPYRFAAGYSLDIAAAMAASSVAAEMLERPGSKVKTARLAVTTVIMALPVK